MCIYLNSRRQTIDCLKVPVDEKETATEILRHPITFIYIYIYIYFFFFFFFYIFSRRTHTRAYLYVYMYARIHVNTARV